MTSSVSSWPRASSTHWNRRSPTPCWQRRSPRGPAADWHRRCPSSRAGWRCSKRPPVAGCSCIGSTTTPAGFVIHQLFAEFLRRRLARDDPERSRRLHRTAAAWFAEHGYLNEAVNHALAVDSRNLPLTWSSATRPSARGVKNDDVPRDCQETAARLLAFRARLQLAIAWANILLQRRAPADAALNRFEAALGSAELSDAARTDLRVEADVLRGVADLFADRSDRIDSLVSEAVSRADTLHPRVPGVAGNVAAFAAVYRFEFDDARRFLQWAAPYQDMMGPFASVLAHSWAGIAAKYELHIPTARREFREAFEIGTSGVSRHWLTAWSATRPRATLARMSSAVAVHTNGLGSLLCAAR